MRPLIILNTLVLYLLAFLQIAPMHLARVVQDGIVGLALDLLAQLVLEISLLLTLL